MKGLLIKDFKLCLMQKKFFVVIIALAFFMALFMKNSYFLLGYLGFVIPTFAISTIAYDEFDNGNAFLFTLPISRRLYVAEKYIFSLLLGALSFALAVLLIIAYSLATGSPLEGLKGSPAMFGIVAVFISILIPLQLKLGSEKSRVAVFLVTAVLFALGYAILKLCTHFNFDIIGFLENTSMALLISGFILAVIVFLLLSFKISTNIMKKKEF